MNFSFFSLAYQAYSIILHTMQMCRNLSPLHKDLALYCIILGHMIAHFVEALCYKLEGHGFDSQSMLLEFFIDIIHLAALWPWGLLSS